MVVFDILLNLFRKSLGHSVYQKLKKSPLGRPYDYYSISTYKNIFDKYKSTEVDFTSKRILEVGCGEQFYTAYYFLSAGAESVSLADPIFSQNPTAIQASQLKKYQEYSGDNSALNKSNIHYYKSLDDISKKSNEKFDFICSHFVLEHFTKLDNFFYNIQILLNKDGISYNFIDLSDHAYHLFDSRIWTKWLYRTRMLYHLRYSDSFYNFITDKRIWVNRLLLPAYKNLSRKHGLRIMVINPKKYHKVKIHKDVLNRNQTSGSKDLYITHFSILLTKER